MCVGHILPQILITRVQQRWLAKRKRHNRLIWWWCGKFVQSDVGGIFLGASKKKKKNRIRSPSTVSQPAPKVGQSVWPSPPYSNQPLTPFFIGITITVVVVGLLIYKATIRKGGFDRMLRRHGGNHLAVCPTWAACMSSDILNRSGAILVRRFAREIR